MLTLPDMSDLFMHEFPGLRRRRFALSRIFSSSLTDFFFRHKLFLDESNCASMFVAQHVPRGRELQTDGADVDAVIEVVDEISPETSRECVFW